MRDTTKPGPPRRMDPRQVALGLERIVHRFDEAVRSAKPGDFSGIMILGRGLNELSESIVEGNRGLSLASKKEVLLAYDIDGPNPRARIGAYVSLEPTQTFHRDGRQGAAG